MAADARMPKEYCLTERPPEPKAVPGCGACLGICARRQNARSRGDYSAVSDTNVALKRHQDQAHA
ncbi:hypothetical protein Sm713_29180 [Streptomyces sp. TS71-3]|nr:hypothetical protein Sm713_29180 [Streptomyces sp. TS71-3]